MGHSLNGEGLSSARRGGKLPPQTARLAVPPKPIASLRLRDCGLVVIVVEMKECLPPGAIHVHRCRSVKIIHLDGCGVIVAVEHHHAALALIVGGKPCAIHIFQLTTRCGDIFRQFLLSV